MGGRSLFDEVEVSITPMLIDEIFYWLVMYRASIIPFALTFCRDLMVRLYRYNKHRTLPEKGYGAAS